MLSTTGVAFESEGEDIWMNHILGPASQMPWEVHSLEGNADKDGNVRVFFLWSMVRIEHEFRLEPLDAHSPVIFRGL